MRKDGDKVFLEFCGAKVDSSITGVQVGSVMNSEGWGVLDDTSVDKVKIIGGQSWVKQYLINGITIGTLMMMLPLYLELFYYAQNGAAGLPDSIYLDSTFKSQ